MPRTIPPEIALRLLAGYAVRRTEITAAMDVNYGIAEAVQAFARQHGMVAERSLVMNHHRSTYVLRQPVDDELPGTLIDTDGGAIYYPRRHRPTGYFIATDGHITIWRPIRRDKVFRSAIIKGFSRQWRAARPTALHCYPAVRIKPEQMAELLAAKRRAGEAEDDGWIANKNLPPSIQELLDRPVEPTMGYEPAMADVVRDAVA